MSPIVRDLGHSGAFEELWLARRPGEPSPEAELDEVYEAFRTPRPARGDLELPAPERVLERMSDVRAATLEAAAWDPASGRSQSLPWGEDHPTARTANLDQLAFGPLPIGRHPAGRSAVGCEGLLGDVWEWTDSTVTSNSFRDRDYPIRRQIFAGLRLARDG